MISEKMHRDNTLSSQKLHHAHPVTIYIFSLTCCLRDATVMCGATLTVTQQDDVASSTATAKLQTHDREAYIVHCSCDITAARTLTICILIYMLYCAKHCAIQHVY